MIGPNRLSGTPVSNIPPNEVHTGAREPLISEPRGRPPGPLEAARQKFKEALNFSENKGSRPTSGTTRTGFTQTPASVEPTEANMEKLIQEAKLATPEQRKKLIPNNKVMQEVLAEMAQGKISPNRAQQHAALIAHLEDQLAPRESKVPGVRLTGFSHIRMFDSVVPHDFEPTTTDNVQKQIVKDSLAYARNPTGEPPPHLFTVDQFHGKQSPPADPNISDPVPGDAIHGHDLANNAVVGLQANHPGMAELFAMMNTAHLEPVKIGNGKDAWADTAWLAALTQVEPDNLEERLTEYAKAHGQSSQLQAQIAKIRTAAQNIQAKMKDASDRADQKHMNEALQAELSTIRKEMDEITPVLLSSKTDIHNEPLVREGSVGDQTHMASLMSILGTECVILKHDDAGLGKESLRDLTFHSADMGSANAAFDAKDAAKETDFLAEKVRSVPVVVVGPSGFQLKLTKTQVAPATDQAT